MTENAIENESISKPSPDTAKPKGARKAARKPRLQRRRAGLRGRAAKPKADRTNEKAEVIAMMKRAKGAFLVSILGSKGERRSSRPRTPLANRTYKIGK